MISSDPITRRFFFFFFSTRVRRVFRRNQTPFFSFGVARAKDTVYVTSRSKNCSLSLRPMGIELDSKDNELLFFPLNLMKKI